MAAVNETSLPGVRLAARGKVRDIYDLGDRLLIVATDRISAFDCILPTPVPDKGKVLNQVAAFWFDRLADVVPNHVVEIDASRFPAPLDGHIDQLGGRSVLAAKADIFPVECVVRGYISGSGWKDYQSTGAVCGIPLPEGLKESERLPEPLFTPATKATEGHDENISFDRMVEIVGAETAETLRALTLRLYREGTAYAESRGIIIADTKFEFGLRDGSILLCDEVLTPDSSRFWPADAYAPGGPQASFDKQYVRDYLLSIGWNRQPPVPGLPDEIVAGARERYLEIFRILTGKDAPSDT